MHVCLVFALISLVSSTQISKESAYLGVMNTIFNELTTTTTVTPSTSYANRQGCVNALKPVLNTNVNVTVYDVGNFIGQALAAEYLCITTVNIIGNVAITGVSTPQYLYDSADDALWVLWTLSATNRVPSGAVSTTSPLYLYDTALYPQGVPGYISAKVTFDSQNRILDLQGYFGNYIAFLAYGLSFSPTDANAQLEIIAGFCELAIAACGATTGFTASFGNPVVPPATYIATCTANVLTYAASNPSFFAIGSPFFQTNTLGCREAHVAMAFVAPATHCPHVYLQSTMCTQTTFILS